MSHKKQVLKQAAHIRFFPAKLTRFSTYYKYQRYSGQMRCLKMSLKSLLLVKLEVTWFQVFFTCCCTVVSKLTYLCFIPFLLSCRAVVEAFCLLTLCIYRV